MSTQETDGRREEWGSVLFVDLRNFTNLLEFYGPSRVRDVLDEVFLEFKRTIRSYGGEIDKLVGDGMMAVFRDERGRDCERNAVRAAAEMLYRRLPDLERRANLNLKIGIGISTGAVLEANLADIDETIIGRNVNIAARLQSLCKKYDIPVLTDRKTRTNIHDLADGYRFRLIPDQRVEGIYESMDIFEICSVDRYDEEYLERFNAASRDYKDGDYSRALEFFISSYSDATNRDDQFLLHYFASECFDRLDTVDSFFTNADQYDQHSTTQKTQSDYLFWRLEQFVADRDLVPSRVLDIGCGSGDLTSTIPEKFADARVVAIDESKDQIRKARQDHGHPNVEYEVGDIVEYASDRQFDVVASNSVMHWVQQQDTAYENLYDLLAPGGILAVHQGGSGCYRELREAAEQAYKKLGFEEYFRDFQYPLVYHTKAEMHDLLERNGFEIITLNVMESEQPETLVDDFAEAGLLPYRRRLTNEAERYAFVEQYKEFAREYDEIDTTRIYGFATRPN